MPSSRPNSLRRADDDGRDHLALLDVAVRDRLLDRRDDRVADAGVAALRAAARRGCTGSRARRCCRPREGVSPAGSLAAPLQRPPRAASAWCATSAASPPRARGRPRSRRCARRARAASSRSRTIFLYMRWRRVTSMRTAIVLSGLAEHDPALAHLRAPGAVLLRRRRVPPPRRRRGSRHASPSASRGTRDAPSRSSPYEQRAPRRASRPSADQPSSRCLLSSRSTSIPRSPATVSVRARSRLARLSAAVSSSCPVACWKRRLNSS